MLRVKKKLAYFAKLHRNPIVYAHVMIFSLWLPLIPKVDKKMQGSTLWLFCMFVANCAVLKSPSARLNSSLWSLNVCAAEVTDEAVITSGSGNIALITIEYVLSKQLCMKPLTCCELLIS